MEHLRVHAKCFTSASCYFAWPQRRKWCTFDPSRSGNVPGRSKKLFHGWKRWSLATPWIARRIGSYVFVAYGFALWMLLCYSCSQCCNALSGFPFSVDDSFEELLKLRQGNEDREEWLNARERQRTLHVHQCVLASVRVCVVYFAWCFLLHVTCGIRLYSCAGSEAAPKRKRGAKEDREEWLNARERQRTIHVHQCVLASACVCVV